MTQTLKTWARVTAISVLAMAWPAAAADWPILGRDHTRKGALDRPGGARKVAIKVAEAELRDSALSAGAPRTGRDRAPDAVYDQPRVGTITGFCSEPPP
jgi:hypothetical protein